MHSAAIRHHYCSERLTLGALCSSSPMWEWAPCFLLWGARAPVAALLEHVDGMLYPKVFSLLLKSGCTSRQWAQAWLSSGCARAGVLQMVTCCLVSWSGVLHHVPPLCAHDKVAQPLRSPTLVGLGPGGPSLGYLQRLSAFLGQTPLPISSPIHLRVQSFWLGARSKPGLQSQATPPLGVSLQMWAQPWSLFMQFMPSGKRDRTRLGGQGRKEEPRVAQLHPLKAQPCGDRLVHLGGVHGETKAW